MRLVFKQGKTIYIQLEDVAEAEYFDYNELKFFRGFGITDYKSFFKMWLRRFPKPIIILAIHGRTVVGFVYIEDWGEGTARDGNPVYVIRSIEVAEKARRRKVGTYLVCLSMAMVPGHIITKPIDSRAMQFFRSIGFQESKEIINPPVDLKRKTDHLLLPNYKKNMVLEDWGIKRIMPSISLVFKIRVDTLKTAERIGEELEKKIEMMSKYATPTTTEYVSKVNDKPKTKMHTVEKTCGRKNLAIVYTPRHVDHYHRERISLESPRRIESIYKILRDREKIFQSGICDLITDYPPADDDTIALVHDIKYIESIKEYCRQGGGIFGPDMFFTSQSYIAAAYAVGGAIKAVEIVYSGEYRYSIALIRPPGHHASKNKYGGFCIFNNSAIAARYLQNRLGARRVAIVDWDAHAANGTMHIFYDDPSVLLISIHQNPAMIYPREGFISEIGEGEGKGYTVNIPMPIMSSDSEYKYVFEDLVIPILMDYKPDFVIGVNGFDAYWGEPYTKLLLTSEGYYNIALKLSTLYRNRFAIIIEGGYHKKNPNLMITLIDALLGKKNSFVESPGEVIKPSERDRFKLKYEIIKLVKEIKTTLSPYYNF